MNNFLAIQPAPNTSDKRLIGQALNDYLRVANACRLSVDKSHQWHQIRLQIKTMQVQRLTRTYTDLLNTERYNKAARFFLDDLYGPRVSTRRDDELVRIVPTMIRILPTAALHTIMTAMELDALTEQMDAALADYCYEQLGDQPFNTLTVEQYARAYRFASNTSVRERQVALVQIIGQALDQLVRKPLVSGALAIMETPARMAGLIDLHLFLNNGFSAFKRINGAQWFLLTVTQRESDINQQLLGGLMPKDFEQL